MIVSFNITLFSSNRKVFTYQTVCLLSSPEQVCSHIRQSVCSAHQSRCVHISDSLSAQLTRAGVSAL